MKLELLALEKNNIWILVLLPPGKTPIGNKWVYKIKHKSDGAIKRYTETFALVAKMVTDIKKHLNNKFSIKDLGSLHYYLGIEFFINSTGLAMSQRKYATELVTHAGLLDTKPSSIPLDPMVKLTMTGGEPIYDPSIYRTLVGKLLYLTITRPDLAFSAQALRQFLQEPTTLYMKVILKVIRYVKLALS
ncbi:uncharacterized mitochondrial protein-like protein [Tanacetum coccineum]